jgi:hypothetical protein
MKHLSTLATLLALLAPAVGRAQDLDLDEEGGGRKEAKREVTTREASQGVVREIERGVYLKSNVGTTVFFGGMSGLLKPGTTLNLTLGMDVVDKPKASVAWELNFVQALHNSKFPDYTYLAGAGLPANQLIQGDIHTFNVMAGVEASAYPVRRVGIGGHLGGGVSFIPLLLDKGEGGTTYAMVLSDLGVTGLPVHDRVHGVVYAGPTIEYYTKLSHFSIGIDADFIYILGVDFGLMATGYFKYSF